MENILSDSVTLGILASVVTGLLTLIPALGATDLRRNVTAIVVLVAGVFFYSGYEYTTVTDLAVTLVSAGVSALTTYKMFLQTLVIEPVKGILADKSDTYARAEAKAR
jgi:glucan phosphoethanolaminetransferase (alkaline phosphatase superfamily)